MYLRALYTLPRVSVHFGHFLVTYPRVALFDPPSGSPTTAQIVKTEEKGSDVNLATFMLADAFRNDAEAYVVINNDSDLMQPLRLVQHELGHTVGILNPHPNPSHMLLRCKPTFTKSVRAGVVASCKLPDRIVDAYGSTIEKPADWA